VRQWAIGQERTKRSTHLSRAAFEVDFMAWEKMILAQSKEKGVVPCIHNGTPEAAMRRIVKGFQLVTIGSHARLMAAGAQGVLGLIRDGLKVAGGAGY
jgi:hypothetical protein